MTSQADLDSMDAEDKAAYLLACLVRGSNHPEVTRELARRTVRAIALLALTPGGPWAGPPEGPQTLDLTIPIRRRDDPPTGAELERRLRQMGWDDERFSPDMRACLDDIAAGLRQMREEDAQDPDERG